MVEGIEHIHGYCSPNDLYDRIVEGLNTPDPARGGDLEMVADRVAEQRRRRRTVDVALVQRRHCVPSPDGVDGV